MKKLILVVVALLLVSGCSFNESPSESSDRPIKPTPGEIIIPVENQTEGVFTDDWQTYVDPDGRFQLSYPPGWLQTDGGGEIQFWDELDDGVNSVKMALIKTDNASFDELKIASTQDRGPHFTHTFLETTTHTIPTLIEYGESDTVHYRAFYYQLDNTIFQYNALFHDDNIQVWDLALRVQDSFQRVKN